MPILYSFRRCPFAIRARLSIVFAGVEVELREVSLRDKPAEMLRVSPKGTVPVLVDAERVIDESLDIIEWSLEQSAWCDTDGSGRELISLSDEVFKPKLDHYKYSDRHPGKTRVEYRELASDFPMELNLRLDRNEYLGGDRMGMEDVAIFPFIRQFANVDRAWFDEQPWTDLVSWLRCWETSAEFQTTMQKFTDWRGPEPGVMFPGSV